MLTQEDSKVAFFDELAERWDGFEDMDRLSARLEQALNHFGLTPDEGILEAGCGTGNLTLALTRALGPQGWIDAVDCSPRMLEKARTKLEDPRVCWIQSKLEKLPSHCSGYDRAILMGVWPHLENKDEVLDMLVERLRPGGFVHVWHLASRERINQIHASAHPSVAHDLLEPVEEIAARFSARGFRLVEAHEDSQQHLLSAQLSPG